MRLRIFWKVSTTEHSKKCICHRFRGFTAMYADPSFFLFRATIKNLFWVRILRKKKRDNDKISSPAENLTHNHVMKTRGRRFNRHLYCILVFFVVFLFLSSYSIITYEQSAHNLYGSHLARTYFFVTSYEEKKKKCFAVNSRNQYDTSRCSIALVFS